MPVEVITLRSIKTDANVQVRTGGTDSDTVATYSRAMSEGVEFPPVVCFRDSDGTTWLADGFHRFDAASDAQMTEIRADVREGNRRDALMFSLRANSTHGRPLSNSDKRAAVQVMLDDDEWTAWSDRDIAKHIGVSNSFVSRMRKPVVCTKHTSPAVAEQTVQTEATIVPATVPQPSPPARQPAADPVEERLWQAVEAASPSPVRNEVPSATMATPVPAPQTHSQEVAPIEVTSSSEIDVPVQAPASQVGHEKPLSDDRVIIESEPEANDVEDPFIDHLEERSAAADAALDRLSDVEDMLTQEREYSKRLERDVAVLMVALGSRAQALRQMTDGQFQRGERNPIELDRHIEEIQERLSSPARTRR